MTIDYAEAGPLTRLSADQIAAASRLPREPIALCRAAQALLILPGGATGADLSAEQFAERNLRPAAHILDAAVARGSAPLGEARPVEARVVGTCRHFSVLSVALLRAQGFAARSRCGFASYFQTGKHLDHWVIEYRRDGRWVRVDPEILGFGIVDNADDLAPGEFLTGGEAWRACQAGADPSSFGVDGTDHAWGIGEVRGNAIRDLAALNKMEMLPWDEWGRMTASYKGETGPDFDRLIDAIADVTADADDDAVAALYASEDLAVPDALELGS